MKLTGKMVSYNKGIVEIELPKDDARVIERALHYYSQDASDSHDGEIALRLLGEDKPKKIEPFLDYDGYPEENVPKEFIIRKLNEIIAYINKE